MPNRRAEDTAVFDVCVVGSANLDLVATAARLPAPGETVMGTAYHEFPGGKGLNQVVAAARAGANAAFVGALGTDVAASVLRGVLDDDSIDHSRVATVDAPTGRALIGIGSDGENSIIVVPGANARVTADLLPAAKVVLTQLEVPVAVVATALAAARTASAVTVLNPAPAAPLADHIVALCDIVVPNEHEVELLGGVQHLLAAGARAVVVTLGARGAALHTTHGETRVPAFPVDAVDTTGAGDTFCGSLCARLAAGVDLPAAIRYASAAAALSTTAAGAVPSIPTADEVARFVAESGREL